MKCPVCVDVNLVMTDRQGVEIDYCPECRGVWLDRGELDKIIERSNSMSYEEPSQSYSKPKKEKYNKYDGDNYRRKKKENIFSDIFDFDF